MALNPSAGWQWCRELNISNPSADYQIRLRLYKNDSTKDNPSNGTLDLAGKCKNFPDDIRFGTTDNPNTATQLKQWIEKKTADYIDIWVKLPSPSQSSIYLFVGNSDARKYSDYYGVTGNMIYLGTPEYLGEKIPLSASGWDSSRAFAENITYDPFTQKYWICYHNNNDGIGLAYSDTIDGTYTKLSSNPVLTTSASGWDSDWVADGELWIDTDNITDHKYWIVYAGASNAGDWSTHKIGLAYCDDILNGTWTKYSGNPILEPSNSGWDSERVGEPSLIYDGSKFVLFYMGTSSGAATERVGYATANNITGPYTKYSGNPVIDISSNRFDKDHTADPSVGILEDGTYMIMYTGCYDHEAPDHGAIGIVVSRDLQNFTKIDANPILSIDDNKVEDLNLKGGWYETDNYIYFTYSRHGAGSESGYMARCPKKIGFKNTDLALSGTATASGYYSSYDPSNAVDGNDFNGWVADTENAWLKIDLGSEKHIGAVYWVRTDFRASDRVPENYTISISSDDSNYTEIVNVTGNNRCTNLHSFDERYKARYVKIHITKTNSGDGTSIGRFSVYEHPLLYVEPEPTWSSFGPWESIARKLIAQPSRFFIQHLRRRSSPSV